MDLKKAFDESQVIETEQLRLRKCEHSDIPECFELAKNSNITKYVTWEPHVDISETEQFINSIIAGYEAGTNFTWAICNKQTGAFMGLIGFIQVSERNLNAEIGYWLGEQYQNFGYMTEALRAVIDFGFNKAGLHRITAGYMAQNLASGRVMITAGMNYEGLFRDAVKKDGKYYDILRFAVINKADSNKEED